MTIADVKTGHAVYRLWKDGAPGRSTSWSRTARRPAYDRLLPGPGLLVYHVDEAVSGNSNESHPQVGLLQADGTQAAQRRRQSRRCGRPLPGIGQQRDVQ